MTLLARIFLITASLSVTIPLFAQVSETPAEQPSAGSDGIEVPTLTIQEVEASLAVVEADATINEAQKAALQSTYQQIIEVLQQAADLAARSSSYQMALEAAPKSTSKNREQLLTLPSVEAAGSVDVEGDSTDVRKALITRQAMLKGLSDELANVSAELLTAEARPVEIGKRLPQAQRELSAIRNQLEVTAPTQAAKSPTSKAEHLVLLANYQRLVNETKMLQQEQLSQSVRETELRSRRDLLTRQVENAKVAFDVLTDRLEDELSSDVDHIHALAQTVSEDLPDVAAVQELAAEVQSLAQQFEDVVDSLKRIAPAESEVQDRFTEVNSEYRSIRNELSLGSGGSEMAQVLLELARHAQPASLKQQVSVTLEQARLAWFAIKNQRRKQAAIASQFANHPSEAFERLVAARLEILEKHLLVSANLTQALAELQTEKQSYFDLCKEVQVFVSARLFGMGIRSCPPAGLQTLTGIPAGLAWLSRAEHRQETTNALMAQPLVSLAALLLAIILSLRRRSLIAALEATGPPTRKISTDHFSWTTRALLWTLLLAAPISILVGASAWILTQTPDASEWMLGLSAGWRSITGITIAAAVMFHVCRPQGLGAIHFKWNEDLTARMSWALKSIGSVYLPMMVVVASSGFDVDSGYYESVGRTAFLLAHAWTMFMLWRILRSPGKTSSDRKSGSHSRLRRIWHGLRLPLLIGIPFALIALACLGFLITATVLSVGVFSSAAIIAGGEILLGLVRRWFEIRKRRLAFAEAMDKRKARLAAAEEQPEQGADELLQFDEEEELGLGLNQAVDQTFAFLRLFFNLGMIALLYSYWSSVIPLMTFLDSITVPLSGGHTLLTLAQAILVSVVCVVIIRNLPGLLEFSVLRNSTIEAGTRNAIYTLSQYAIIGLGLVALSNILRVDWAKFGWMAAALSVGLGFGLQEVVANFVCGLIVLFERPIRVGDVVTIEGTTGTVTNINMRATTITNWDRQDFVVPNKNLVTGTILNWTLSASLNRIVIPVGVAYGTDTELARQILLDVAAEHPEILDEPAPMASFEQLADHSLNLVLRAYLPNLDNRIGAITDLHTEIVRRFAAAGIEIPFPQQDLHLRSGWQRKS